MSLNLLTLLTLGQVLGGPEFSVQQPAYRAAEFSFTAPTVAPSSVDSYTLALWHMDESSGAPVDSAGYDGGIPSSAFYGTVQAGVGVFDGERYFVGNSSSGSPSGACTSGAIPPGTLQALLTGDYTWSAWLYRGTSPATQAYENPIILSDGAVNYGVTFGLSVNNSTNKMEFYWKIGSSSYESHASSASLPTGGWHHVAATVSVTGGGATRTVAIYLDGALDSTFTGWVKPYVGITTQIAYIGCAESGYYAWAGGIDDMLIASRAYSAAEVLALYRQSGRWSSPPTPARGPTMTFARASTSTYETASGHVVNALSGELRCGYLGCLVEPSRTNSMTQSAALDTWTKFNSGASAITVSANAAAAPDGTFAADQLSLPAVTAGQYAIIGQTGFTLGATGATMSIWLRASSGTASTYLYVYDTTASTYLGNTLCSLTTSWARCTLTVTGTAGHSVNAWLGTDASPGSGMSGTSASTILAWGGQLEGGPYVTSHIPTVGTAVTRASDVLSVPSSVLGTSAASFRLTLFPEWASSATGTKTLLDSDVASELSQSVASDALSWSVNGNTVTTAGTLGWTALALKTVNASYASAGVYRITDGTASASGTSPGTPAPATLYLGGTATVGGGVHISQVKVCKRSGTCR